MCSCNGEECCQHCCKVKPMPQNPNTKQPNELAVANRITDLNNTLLPVLQWLESPYSIADNHSTMTLSVEELRPVMIAKADKLKAAIKELAAKL